MGVNKKRDKKNFKKMRKGKKEYEPKAHDGVVDFLGQREIQKMTSMGSKAKRNFKQFNKKCRLMFS